MIIILLLILWLAITFCGTLFIYYLFIFLNLITKLKKILYYLAIICSTYIL